MFPPKVQRGIELALDANRRGYLDPARLQAVLTFYDRDGATDPPDPELVLQRVGGLTTAQLTDLLGITAEPIEGTPFTDRLSLLEPLGEGAMGAVYRAHDRVLKRTVAVKVIKPDRLDAANAGRLLARFEREAQAMARVRHPACVPIFDAGVEKQSGRPYIVMGLVAGKSLRQLIAEGDGRPLDWRRVAAWGRDLALGLQACHDVGVVHRDVKPANVLVDADDRPFLTDFGVALDDQARTKLTAEQAAVGTLAYMAPEQATGHPVDARVDVYALGATLYEAATGRAPFEATHALLLIRQIVEAHPEPLKKLAPDAPADLDAVLQQALAKHRDDRYATAQALALDLARVLAGEPVLARRTAQEQLARWLARRRRPLALAATLAAGLTAATLLALQARARQLRAEVLGAVEAAATTSDLETAARELARHEQVADAELGRAVRAAQDDLAARRALASAATYLDAARRARARSQELEEERYQLRTLLADAPLSASPPQLQRLRDLGAETRSASRALGSSLDGALTALSETRASTWEPARLALLAEVLALRMEAEKDPVVADELKEELRRAAPLHTSVAPVAVAIDASPPASCRVWRLAYDPSSGLMQERLAASGTTPLTAQLPPDDYLVTWEANDRLPTRRCLRVSPAAPRDLAVALVDSNSLGALALLGVVAAPGGQCRRGEELRPKERVDDLLVQQRETALDVWVSFVLADSAEATGSWPPFPRRLPAGAVKYRSAVLFAEWWTGLLHAARSPWKARLPRLPELHWLIRGEFEWSFPWGPLLEPSFFANSSTVPRGLASIDAFPEDRSWANVHALAGSCYEWVESDESARNFRTFGASVATPPAQAGSALSGWGTYAQDLAYDVNTVRLVFEPCPLPAVVTDLAGAQRHTQAAWRLQAEEKLFEAQQAWDQAITANPLDADLWVARGGCKNLRGDLWGAWWDLSRALALGTADDTVVRFNRAFVQLQRGLPSEAAEDVTKALQAKPDWPEGLILLGRVRAAQGAFDAARDALRSALRLDPSTEPRVRKRLAEVGGAGPAPVDVQLERARDGTVARRDETDHGDDWTYGSIARARVVLGSGATKRSRVMHRARVAPRPRLPLLQLLALTVALAGGAAAQQVQVAPLTGAASAQASAANLVRESGGGSLAHYLPKTPRPAAGFPTIVVVPGHECAPTDYTIVRDQLLRRGFGVALFALGDNSELSAERWDDRLELLVAGLLAETRRTGSPLLGTVDGAKLGIVGHSLGGAVATLRAARDARWKALVVCGPGGQEEGFLSEARTVRGATLAVDAGLDRITPPDTHGGRVVERSASPHRAQVVIAGGAHPNSPADFDADYIREPKLVTTPLPFWPFVTWSYDFPIVPGVKPIASATQRAIAFRYLLPWLERFVAGRDTTAIREATDGRRARRDVTDGALSKATFSPATATTTGLAGGLTPN